MTEFTAPEGTESARASSLPTWPDCQRRWMATQRGWLLRSLGYRFQYHPYGIGLYAGSASHAGLAHGWLGFELHGDWTKQEYCDELAVDQLRSDTDGGRAVAFDKANPDLDSAEQAVMKMMRAYRVDVDPLQRPTLVEHAMAAKAHPGFYLTGHCDLFLDPELALEDYKTGVRIPDPIQQVGAYILTLQSEGRQVRKSRMRWIRRVGKKTEQPPPMTVPYDVELAAFLAKTTLAEIDAKLKLFARTHNPFVFTANTSSVLCGPKYCPAFGTAFCPESRAKAVFMHKDED